MSEIEAPPGFNTVYLGEGAPIRHQVDDAIRDGYVDSPVADRQIFDVPQAEFDIA
jgi:hypothetical protein